MPIDTETGEIIVEEMSPTRTQPPFESLYSHNRARSRAFATFNNEETLTQQDDAKETDINIIVERYLKTGQMPQVTAEAMQGDFSTGFDYREAVEKLQHARELFQELPAKVRAEFDNDPAKFIDFANDEKNLEELRRLGLAKPKETPPAPPEPMPVRIIADTPPLPPGVPPVDAGPRPGTPR